MRASRIDWLGVYIPHHVQMFFDHVYQEKRITGLTKATPALVEDVYRQSILGIRGHVELSHLEERLKMVLGPNLDFLALDLLTEAAVVGTRRSPTMLSNFGMVAALISDHPSVLAKGELWALEACRRSKMRSPR